MYPEVFLHVSCLDDLSLGLYQHCMSDFKVDCLVSSADYG